MNATKPTSRRADPSFLLDLQKYGAANIDSCFNCGNCSAVCPLSTEEDNFPRRMIRYTQLGMRDELLSSKELWLCYYCGECTATCPREADPGELMAAARRSALATTGQCPAIVYGCSRSFLRKSFITPEWSGEYL